MSQVTVVAKIKARSDAVDRVKTALLKLVDPTLEEAGCLNYDLHQDRNDTTVFIFYENWISEEHLDQHLGSAHIKTNAQATDGLIELIELHRLTKLDQTPTADVA